MSRWDWLEGVKAELSTRVAVRQLCKLLAEELRAWPPDVEWLDAAEEARFASLDTRAPSPTAITEALRYLRWELQRDYEAIDHYERNRLLEKACSAPQDALSAIFMRRYLSEAFAELFERTENRVKRKEALDGLGELSILLLGN